MNDKERRKGNEFINSLGYFGISKERAEAWPYAYKLLDKLLACVSMIDSVLAYEWDMKRNAKEVLEHDKKYKHYDWQTGENEGYLEHYANIFGDEIVVNLINEQMARIVAIKVNTYCDDEGVTYNTVTYRD